MKFITARDLRLDPTKVWAVLEEGSELVVTLNGKPKAIMIHSDEEHIEEMLSLARRLRAQMAVGDMQRSAGRSGLSQLSLTKINEIIQKARKERKK